MESDANILKLKVSSEVGETLLELRPGKSVLIGRRPDADVVLARPSVSQEHLRITWDGKELLVRDLDSKFGTFRLPQDSPFKESSFPPVYAPLELRISKSKVVLSWSLAGAEDAPEPTEVLASTRIKTMLGESAPKAAKLEVDVPTFPRSSSVVPAPAVAAPAPRRRAMAPEMRALAARYTLLSAVLVAFVLILSRIFILRGFLVSAPAILAAGGAWDMLAIWNRALRLHPNFWVGAFVLWIVLQSFIWVRARNGKLHAPVLLRWVPRSGAATVRVYILCAALVWALALFWPGLWAMRYGLPANALPRAAALDRATRGDPTPQMSLEDLQNHIQDLKTARTDFPGSSLIYKSLIEFQRARVLKECSGQGEASWENKKVCLVLLFAVSVEAREEAVPALLDDTSARVSILLSLDGITRVLASEGASAPMIPFFLESLELVGLGAEKEDILKLLSEANTSTEKTVDTLKQLRNRIEERLEARQRELALPADLRVRLPGPLESGI